jgi:hypothetical protein
MQNCAQLRKKLAHAHWRPLKCDTRISFLRFNLLPQMIQLKPQMIQLTPK